MRWKPSTGPRGVTNPRVWVNSPGFDSGRRRSYYAWRMARASQDDLCVEIGVLRQRGVERHHVAAPLAVEWLRKALSDTDSTVGEPGAVELDLDIDGTGTVLVRGRLTVGFEVPCARCLDPAAIDGDTELCVTYVVGTPRAAIEDEELTLEPEDLEQLVYDGERIDLRPMLAEQVALAYPMRALCGRGEACRGLCTGCGAALNAQPANASSCAECGISLGSGEAESGEDSPWKAALRGLKAD